jgi:hypothetical protein
MVGINIKLTQKRRGNEKFDYHIYFYKFSNKRFQLLYNFHLIVCTLIFFFNQVSLLLLLLLLKKYKKT